MMPNSGYSTTGIIPVTGNGTTSVTQYIAINATTYKHFIAWGYDHKKKKSFEWTEKLYIITNYYIITHSI